MTINSVDKMGMYIHIPFCVKKCNYCDFMSGPATESIKDAYVNALCKQLEAEADNFKAKKVRTIFFGGGTPTTLSISKTDRILDSIHKNYHMELDMEVTTEANPGTLNEEKLKAYQKMGFNRLSIGLQSANNAELNVLGRIHTYEDFCKEYDLARECGFLNINVDLMSAIPDQTEESYYETLSKVVRLSPEHISAYSLILEEGTPLNEMYEAGKLDNRLVDEDADRRMYHKTREILELYGYSRYEISNYAKKGYECKHNLAYWERGNYAGFGVGAASLIDNKRYRIVSNIKDYIANSKNATLIQEEIQNLTKKDCMEEFMFLGLRKMQGVSESEFANIFSTDIYQVYGDVIKKNVSAGLLNCSENRIFLTERGIDVSNTVMAEFLLDE